MSDDNDTSQVAGAAAPKAASGWSEQDRRVMVITIAGGLAANLGTVILVGAAIGFVHLLKRQGGPSLTWTLGGVAVGLAGIALGNFLRLDRNFTSVRLAGWLSLVVGSLWLLESVLILTGLAAGVK